MKGYIYEIVSPNFEKRYVGCCIQNSRGRDTLKERFHMHKGKHNGTTSEIVIEKGDAELRLIECVDVESLIELRAKERDYISSHRDELVNKSSIYSCRKEQKEVYTKLHKEDKRLYDIEYRKTSGIQQKLDCECGGSYLLKHKTTHFKTKKHLKSIPHLANSIEL